MKDAKKTNVVSHLDKTLDDYIKKARGQDRGSKKIARKPLKNSKAKPGQKPGQKPAGKRVTGVARTSRGIKKFGRGNTRVIGEERRARVLRRPLPPLRRPLPRRALPPLRRPLPRRLPLRPTRAATRDLLLRPTGRKGSPKASKQTNREARAAQAAPKKSPKKITVRKEKEDKCRLFVSDLPMNVTNNDLYTLFSQFGPLAKSRLDYDNLGRSYGTAILEYKKEDNAAEAMAAYNGAYLDGKPIKISYQNTSKPPKSPTSPSSKPKKSPKIIKKAAKKPASPVRKPSKEFRGVRRRGMMRRRDYEFEDRGFYRDRRDSFDDFRRGGPPRRGGFESPRFRRDRGPPRGRRFRR